ncbi:MAG: PfkB family carbohydrate kinase [Clostridia bacterium]|nr:PfkB family carbohydrate kinase [Clostridia bacterium]
MTERELEIFEIIKENPSIEQSEIADRLNIARSSVAVHIANMQKKGYILGKGYIVKDSEYVLGIGAANVDIHGRSKAGIVMRDSNPGFMNSSTGGVTRNVCENLARLGNDAKLITAVGSDVYGEKIKKDSKEAGIDISNIYVAEGHASSTYMTILDEKGDMLVALSDMRVLKQLPLSYLRSKMGLIKNAKVVTIDPSLTFEEMEEIVKLCKEADTPLFMDPVSTAYAKVIEPLVGNFHTIKPNEMELGILAGMEIKKEKDYEKAAQILIERGVKRVFVSRGKDGCFYMDSDGNVIRRKFKPIEKMANASGAGDSFMAGVIHSFMHGYDVDKTIDIALGAGLVAVQSEKTINPEMSVEYINRMIKERKHE